MPAYKEPRHPGRHSIPFTLWMLAAVLACEQAVLTTYASMRRCLEAVAVIAGICLALIVVCTLMRSLGAAPLIAAVTVSACLGIMASSFAASTCRSCASALAETPISAWSFSVIGDARLSQGRYRVRARASCAGNVSADVWLYGDERFYPGMEVQGIGRYAALGAGGWASISRAQGVCGSVTMMRVERTSARGGLLGFIDAMRRGYAAMLAPDHAATRAIASACVVGDRMGFDIFDLDDVLRRCGVSHLVAVSGAHLAIVASLCTRALDASEARARMRMPALVLGTGVFVLLCGAPASAVRAWIMVAVHAASIFANRRSHGFSALCLAALAMALVDPTVSGQLSYQLSVAAVLGIYLVNPYVRYAIGVLCAHRGPPHAVPARVRRMAGALERSALDLLALSITAQLVTLPITVSSFSEISLIAPLANLAASPLIASITLMGVCACMLSGLPILREALLAAIDALGYALLAVLRGLAGLRFASIEVAQLAQPVSVAVLVGVLALAWRAPRLTRRRIAVPACSLCVLMIVWLCLCRFAAPARVVVLDVGQGDAILIQEGSHAVLVDAGPPGSLDKALRRNAVLHLDAIVLSHLHNDHYGGVSDLVGLVPCDGVYVAEGSAEHAPAELVEAAQALGAYPFIEIGSGTALRFGHFTLTVLAPDHAVDGLENEDSLFMLLAYDDGSRTMSMLLTGDGEHMELAGVLGRACLEGVDVLKVGHHGSEGSITADQARILSPAYALCSAGEGNEFGHPHPSTVRVLHDAGCTFLCTKDLGDISMAPSALGARPPWWFSWQMTS